MGKKSTDAKGAAEAQGELSRETARDITYADRPNQTGPFGNVNWTTEQVIDPATGEPTTRWNQSTSLNPGLQRAADASMGFMGDRGELASGMIGRVQDEMGGAPEWDQFGDVVGFDPTEQRQAAEDAAYGKSTARLGKRFDESRDAFDIRMRNQGLSPGNQGYDAQFRTFNEGKNDAYEQARLGSVAEGRQEFDTSLKGNQRANLLRQQQIDEYLSKRGFSLAEANKLMEGQTTSDISKVVGGEA